VEVAMSERPQDPGSGVVNDVVTFILDFAPDRRRWREVDKALVEIGPDLAKTCAGLLQHWHASRHCAHGQYSQLWFRFKSSPSSIPSLVARARAVIQAASGKYGFCLGNEIIEPEPKAFGEGDPRLGHDVVKMIGGRQHLPQLWREIQEATERAIAHLAAAPHGVLAGNGRWLPWSVHIYGNCLGRE